MQFARPPNGFKIKLSKTVDALRRSEVEHRPEFERFWEDLIEYIKIVAHRVGTPEPRLGNGYRLFATGPDAISGQPRIVIGYLVLGDTVTIRLLRVTYH